VTGVEDFDVVTLNELGAPSVDRFLGDPAECSCNISVANWHTSQNFSLVMVFPRCSVDEPQKEPNRVSHLLGVLEDSV
jgi:hypothetical protein